MQSGLKGLIAVVENYRGAASLPMLKFSKDKGFETELHRRIDEYFNNAGILRTATSGMYAKALLVLAIFAFSYLLLVFIAETFWQGVLFATMLGFSIVGIGVNLQHDGSHNAYSSRNLINRLMAMTADFIGASSYFWRWKHNQRRLIT